MGLVSWIRQRIFGPPPPPPGGTDPPRARRVRARYDAAQTTAANANHWAAADDLSANGANSPDVRRTLRRRARYERDNDGHLDGLAQQLGDDLVGTGPRLNLNLGPQHEPAAALVVVAWMSWCRAVDLAEKLRLLHEPRSIDGETFGLLVTNPVIPHPVKLDVKPIEQEQVATPNYTSQDPRGTVDGIEFDGYGNPAYYHVLREHPGDTWTWGQEYDRVPARYVVHWFRPRRPGQARAASEFASSLPIGAQTRRYSGAVLAKAELNASIAGTLETDLAPDDGAAPDFETMDEVPIPHGALMTLPGNWKAKPFETGKETETYTAFATQKRAELGRPVRAPRNLVTGDSSQFNFASGRLDHLPYQSKTWIERERFRARVVDRIFLAWYGEAKLLGLIPDSLPALNEWDWDWHWDGFPSLNPIDDANAASTLLNLNLTTLAEECAARGLHWRDVVDQRAVEQAYIRSKGLAPEDVMPPDPEQVTDADDAAD